MCMWKTLEGKVTRIVFNKAIKWVLWVLAWVTNYSRTSKLAQSHVVNQIVYPDYITALCTWLSGGLFPLLDTWGFALALASYGTLLDPTTFLWVQLYMGTTGFSLQPIPFISSSPFVCSSFLVLPFPLLPPFLLLSPWLPPSPLAPSFSPPSAPFSPNLVL